MIIYFWCIKRRICLLNLFSCFFCILSVSVVVYYFCSFTIVSVFVSDTNFRLAELIFGNTWRHYRSLTGQNRLVRIVSSCSSWRSCFSLNIKTTTYSSWEQLDASFSTDGSATVRRSQLDSQRSTELQVRVLQTASVQWQKHSLVFSRWTRSESSILLVIQSLNLKAHWVKVVTFLLTSSWFRS